MPIHRNLLVVLTSGQRADVFSHIGRWPVHTPHLDAIAKAGVALAGVTASPASTPSLASLYSGLHPRQHGIVDEGCESPRFGGWVKQLVDAGYHAVGVGRVAMIADHLHEACLVSDVGALDPRGCSYLAAVESRGILQRIIRLREQRIKSGPFELDVPALAPTDDVDGFIAQRARQMIEQLPADRPWVCVVAFTGPGNDMPSPANYFNKVEGTAALSEKFVPAEMRTVDHYADVLHPRAMLQRLNPPAIAHVRRHYLGRVALIDHAVGVLRDALDRAGHAPRTWIAFTADHGKLLGERGLVQHRAVLGPALYVPMWFLPPSGLPRRGEDMQPVSHGLVSTVDWVATLCAIAGVDAPRGCIGESMLPAAHGSEVGRDTVLSEFGTRLILETLQHRAVFDTETQQMRSLFDLLKDPEERNELAEHPEAMNLADMLRWTLAGALMRLRPVRAA